MDFRIFILAFLVQNGFGKDQDVLDVDYVVNSVGVLNNNEITGSSSVPPPLPQKNGEGEVRSSESTEYAKAVSQAIVRRTSAYYRELENGKVKNLRNRMELKKRKRENGKIGKRQEMEDHSEPTLIHADSKSEEHEVHEKPPFPTTSTTASVSPTEMASERMKPTRRMGEAEKVCPTMSDFSLGMKSTWMELMGSDGFMDGMKIVGTAISNSAKSIGHCVKEKFKKMW